MSARWTDKADEFLIRYGGMCGDGYAFIASHDLGRTETAGRRRIAWLRKNKPELVAKIESQNAAFDKIAKEDFERGITTGKWK